MSNKNYFLKDEYGYIYKKYDSLNSNLIDEIMDLMYKNLSEAYPIYTYRHYLQNYPDLCVIVYDKDVFIGAIVGGVEITSKNKSKGYIAMLAVKDEYRGKHIGQNLVSVFVENSNKIYKLDEVILETEIDNYAALNLYESLGFVKVKLNHNYYLNGKSAYKLKYFIN